jgi:ubiquinone/menaquinone biosynthesis C-methylase UbiE
MHDELFIPHIEKWKRETGDHADALQDFLSWFNTSKTPEENNMRGWWDFAHHILKPELIRLIGEPFDKVALEIGHGAGRLLVPACHYFSHCIGVDIHPFKEKVDELIRMRGVSNFTTFHSDGRTLPVEDKTIDVVYSFIVLQHLPTLQSLRQYLNETYRVLKPSGAAILHMGFLHGAFKCRHDDISTHPKSTVREITLRLTLPLAKKLLREAGFNTVEMKRSQKSPWSAEYGNQLYAVVKKAA